MDVQKELNRVLCCIVYTTYTIPCKGDLEQSTPGDSSDKLYSMKYVTTYLQEIPQRIR